MHQHRILVLEDEPELAELLVELLRDLSHEVASAGRMEDALSSLRASTPCAVIADLTLPDVAREEVVGSLRTESKNATILLMSAIPAADLERLGRELSVDRVISKPFDLDEFEDALIFGCGFP